MTARRRLSPDEFIALRSMAKERWGWGGQQGLHFYWKFNRTWRRLYSFETAVGWAALIELEDMGLAEKVHCCEKQCTTFFQLSERGQALLERINGPAAPRGATPAPETVQPPRAAWYQSLLERFKAFRDGGR